MTKKQLFDNARVAGADAGVGAASWYFDEGRSNVTEADYRRVLKGIEDGDPAILDTFVSASLSGEHADDMTPQRLYEELGANQAQVNDYGDDLCSAWEDGFNTAYADAVSELCLDGLSRDITINVGVTLDVMTNDELISLIEDCLGKNNVEWGSVVAEED